MKVTETTTKLKRTFTIEISEEEARALALVGATPAPSAMPLSGTVCSMNTIRIGPRPTRRGVA